MDYEEIAGIEMQRFRNRTPLLIINNVPMTIEDVITAAVLTRTHILLLGDRGEGKTLIENELMHSYFGGNANYLRLTPDMRIKDLYQQLMLEEISTARTNKDLMGITGKIKRPLTIIDEINRGPELTQNQALNIGDGYIEIEGEKILLGKEGYSLCVASANIGDKYGGTFPIEHGLLDRFGVIINLNDVPLNPLDTIEILSETGKDMDLEQRDNTDKIVGIWKQIGLNTKMKEPDLSEYILQLFLRHGLNYCGKEPAWTKMQLESVIPEFCGACNDNGSYCSSTMPLSIRGELTLKMLLPGLKLIAESKGGSEGGNEIKNLIQTMYLLAPHNGMISPIFVASRCNGNPMDAAQKVLSVIEQECSEMMEAIKTAIAHAQGGVLTEGDLEPFAGRWNFLEPILLDVNEVYKKVVNKSSGLNG